MESNITEQQYSGDLLSEPHFDEEATILSARAVVPLGEIKAAERTNRRLTFALSLVAALMVGALGATLIYRQRVQTPATETVETSAPDANDINNAAAGEIEANAGGGKSETPADTAATAVSASAASAKVSDAPASEPRDSAAARPKKPATTVAQSSVKSVETPRNKVQDPEEIQAQRRAERIEARRQRREARREAEGEVRGRRVQPTDDLLRIRDIFEGPRRRPRSQRWQ